MHALSINQLEYFYRHQWTGKKIRALEPFSLEIKEGECFGFLGHNGAGKTTTIKAILGLIRPTHGDVQIFGLSSKDPLSRSSLGYVAEQPYFYDYLSVEEILHMYAALSGLRSCDRQGAVNRVLKKLDLEHKRKSPMRSLSKGLTQKVAVAQAICHDPKILILDEPFSGLDPLGRKHLRELFAELRNRGTTIFMSSHILSDVESICSRASILVKGALKAVFDLKAGDQSQVKAIELKFLNNQAIRQDFLGSLGGELELGSDTLILRYESRVEADKALKEGLKAGLQLLSYEEIKPSLEDLFMSLTSSDKQERSL